MRLMHLYMLFKGNCVILTLPYFFSWHDKRQLILKLPCHLKVTAVDWIYNSLLIGK